MERLREQARDITAAMGQRPSAARRAAEVFSDRMRALAGGESVTAGAESTIGPGVDIERALRLYGEGRYGDLGRRERDWICGEIWRDGRLDPERMVPMLRAAGVNDALHLGRGLLWALLDGFADSPLAGVRQARWAKLCGCLRELPLRDEPLLAGVHSSHWGIDLDWRRTNTLAVTSEIASFEAIEAALGRLPATHPYRASATVAILERWLRDGRPLQSLPAWILELCPVAGTALVPHHFEFAAILLRARYRSPRAQPLLPKAEFEAVVQPRLLGSALGDPRNVPLTAGWTRVRELAEEAFDVFRASLIRADISAFFEQAVEGGRAGERRRASFWSAYAASVQSVTMFLSQSAYRRVLEKRLVRDGDLSVRSWNASTSAFVMRFERHTAIEFSETGNALYLYDNTKGTPRMTARAPGALKDKQLGEAVSHSGDWEVEICRRLRRSGIMPAGSVDRALTLVALGLEVVDRRAYGGRLWVLGGTELAETLSQIEGARFTYAPGGSRSTDYRPSWWAP